MGKKRLLGAWLCGLLLASGCARAEAGSTVRFLKVGQADAIVITSAEHAVVIDTGEDEDGEEILEVLRKAGVAKLDALIVTHFDKDHVGGAPAVLDGIPVGAVYDAAYEPDSKRYRAYAEAVEANGVPRMRVTKPLLIELGDLSLTILPTALPYDGDNDQSLAVSMRDGSVSYLFAGDAEEARIDELIRSGLSKHDILKIPHHGRMKENLSALLDAVQPGCAVITDSDKNPAEEETLALLSARGIQAYETRYGDVVLRSGPEGLEVRQ